MDLLSSDWDFSAPAMIRLGLATMLGLVLGIDRELRGMPAGLRTHALVAVSAAATMLSALMLFEELAQRGHAPDPLRVIQGLAQAIGFIAAGVIFVSRGDVHNLTTAANLWLAAAVGIAAGAGQMALAVIAAIFGIVIVSVVRLVEYFLPGSSKSERE
jgi:putative Mg2+ transporter-C (MgtC) family protein